MKQHIVPTEFVPQFSKARVVREVEVKIPGVTFDGADSYHEIERVSVLRCRACVTHENLCIQDKCINHAICDTNVYTPEEVSKLRLQYIGD